MGRKTNTTNTTKAKRVPRRSSSQFSPLEATAVRVLGTRPTTVEVKVAKDGSESHHIMWEGAPAKLDGKKAIAHSASGARRMRAKVEVAYGYKLTPAKKASALKKYEALYE